MITLNIKELCRERGIAHPLTALMKAGISVSVAQAYLKDKKDRFQVQHVEKLCRLLRCTPNDLFTWTPDSKAEDYPENPLQAIRHKPSFDLEKKLKGMSLAEIKKRFGN